jgi:SHS2 domain-containing protein
MTRQPESDNSAAGESTAAHGHELVEHTADIGIRCWGTTPAELFSEAASALFEVMFGPFIVAGDEELSLELQGFGFEELLVTWLNELLCRFELEGFFPGTISFDRLEASRLRARLTGERFDPERWPLERQVKAATYHLLKVEHPGGGWQATIYLDL